VSLRFHRSSSLAVRDTCEYACAVERHLSFTARLLYWLRAFFGRKK
jgi:hypothetical protein